MLDFFSLFLWLHRSKKAFFAADTFITFFLLVSEMKQKVSIQWHILQGNFELNEAARKDLIQARAEPISKYLPHKRVIKEFL